MSSDVLGWEAVDPARLYHEASLAFIGGNPGGGVADRGQFVWPPPDATVGSRTSVVSLGVLLTHPSRRFPWPVLVLAAGVCAAAASTAAQPRSVRSGVYSEIAGQRGGQPCTPSTVRSATAPTSRAWNRRRRSPAAPSAQKWRGAALNKLFERVESMPPAKPNSLSGNAVRRPPRVSAERQRAAPGQLRWRPSAVRSRTLSSARPSPVSRAGVTRARPPQQPGRRLRNVASSA